MLDVRVRSAPSEQTVRAIVSTGSNLSVIREDLAQALGLVTVGQESVANSSGVWLIKTVFANLVFTRDDGGDFMLEAQLGVAPLQVDLLIGTDLLEDGIFHLDMPVGTWTWEVPQ